MTPIDRPTIEDFVFAEAALLDEWRLDEWLSLFSERGRYIVPATDLPEGDPRESLAIVSDDIERLRARVKQLMGKSNWAESPRSRTRRLISNVRILRQDDERVAFTANFAVFRIRYEHIDTYVGRYENELIRSHDGTLRILERKAILDLDSLRPHGKVSIIL
jgi:p-cumate 2,3-dioxygenase beta subunit